VSVILVWILRVVVVVFLIRLVLRALGLWQTAAPRPRPQSPPRDVERSGGTLVQDPHCGTYLPKTRALAIGAGSDTKYFCSPACRDAYAAAHSTAARTPA
jgi:uncharacterized protein